VIEIYYRININIILGGYSISHWEKKKLTDRNQAGSVAKYIFLKKSFKKKGSYAE